MRICLIFNPSAGTADRIKDFLLHLTSDARCELRATSRKTGARQITREAVDEGFQRIVVAGGDGTISQVLNGIAPDFDAVELAVLPFGTGNDLARALGLLPEQLGHACRLAFDETLETIDLMQISAEDTTSYCINVANGGLGGQVAQDILPEDKQRWGPMAYWMTSVSRLMDLQTYHVDLWLDGQEWHLESLGVSVANGRFVGGGFPIAPHALLNDGLLNVTICPDLPMFELMAAGVNFTLGRDQREDRIQHFRAKKVRIRSEPNMPFSIDGEPSCRIDATFDVIPKALRVVVGANATGLVPLPPEPPFLR